MERYGRASSARRCNSVTAAAGPGKYEVREGLREGELIAASGQFLLDSESRIRGSRTGGPAHGGH